MLCGVKNRGGGWGGVEKLKTRQKKGARMTIYAEACHLTWHRHQNFICAVDSRVIRVSSDHTDFIGSPRL